MPCVLLCKWLFSAVLLNSTDVDKVPPLSYFNTNRPQLPKPISQFQLHRDTESHTNTSVCITIRFYILSFWGFLLGITIQAFYFSCLACRTPGHLLPRFELHSLKRWVTNLQVLYCQAF